MIYCVEDEKNIRELLIYTLETTGFSAKGMANAKELRTALKEELPDLEYIYSEIYNMEKAQIASLSKDVVERTQVAKEAFLDVENEEDKDFLQLFSLVGLLSFDVYMKKNIIESLIDDYTNKANVLSSGKGNVKEDKKEVKKRTKN